MFSYYAFKQQRGNEVELDGTDEFNVMSCSGTSKTWYVIAISTISEKK